MLEVFPERIKTYVERLKRNAERLHTLTSDVLDVTKMEAGILKLNTSNFNLTDIINETIVDIIKRAYVVTGESGVNKNIPTINFDSVSSSNRDCRQGQSTLKSCLTCWIMQLNLLLLAKLRLR